MAAVSTALLSTNCTTGLPSDSSDRNSNPNSVGNNPNLNSLLNRGTTMDNHNINSHNRHQRHHAPPLSSMREYCLRWNNHQPNFVSFFAHLLTKESFVDVTLVSSEGRKIQAHKLVLSACSPYFQHVFETNPCKHPIVILKDVQYVDLKTIITFIYNGEVNIAQDRMNSILATAGTLQVKGLAEVPADELKRVGGPKSTDLNSGRHHPLSPRGDSDNVPNSDVPRKRLKRANLGGISSQSTNGDHSTSGSFESGVGASMSRSMDEGQLGIVGQGLDGLLSKSPPTIASRSGIPPLTAASTTLKSKSLDTGLDKERRDGGAGSADSELSSGGFSDNRNFDESSPGGERGYDLEVADIKMDDVEEEEEGGDLEFEEDDSFGPDDNPDYGDPAYLNMPPSTSAQYFTQAGLHFGASRGRRGRPLLRQPRIKRQDECGRDIEHESLTTPECLSAQSSFELENESEETAAALAAAAYKEKRFGILRKENSAEGTAIDEKSSPQLVRQKSAVPILMVSSSSPTPPSSPPQLSIDESTELSPLSRRSASFDSGIHSGSSKLLSIPIVTVPERSMGGSGSITTGQSGSSHHQPLLVKQVSQPLLPSHSSMTMNMPVQRQHSTPSPGQHSSRILQSIPPKTYTYYLPHMSGGEEPIALGESTYIVDTSTGIIQILSPVPDTLGSGTGTVGGRYTRISHTGNKDMEIFKNDVNSLGESAGSSMEEPVTTGGGSFSMSMTDDQEPFVPVQRSGCTPVVRPGPALGCNFCWNSVDQCGRILRRKTKYQCPECHINLCIVPCFQEYHERADKKRTKLPKLPKPSSM